MSLCGKDPVATVPGQWCWKSSCLWSLQGWDIFPLYQGSGNMQDGWGWGLKGKVELLTETVATSDKSWRKGQERLEHSLSPNCEDTKAWERSVSAGFLESKNKASHSEQELEAGPGSWGDERVSKGRGCICQPATVGLKTPYYGIPIALCTLPFVCLCLPKDFPCIQCSLLKVLAHLRCAGRSQEELSCLHCYLSILEAPWRGQKSPSSP